MLVVDHPISRSADLVIGSLTAVQVPRWNVVRSIFGDHDGASVAPPGAELERQLVTPLWSTDSLRTLASAILPSRILGPALRSQSGPRPEATPAAAPVAGERWFFINGICSDLRLAEINVRELARFTGRPIELLYNATEGFVLDLIECTFGKAWDLVTEAVAPNFEPLVDALADVTLDRVVLVSHSQGTIVAAVMLKMLHEVLLPPPHDPKKVSQERKLARRMVANPDLVQDAAARASFDRAIGKLRRGRVALADIAKLEMYCFANCATSMAPFATVGAPPRKAPWIESYGNDNDLVARLGVLAPEHGAGSSRIEGERYRNLDAWGHLFNASYLVPMYGARETPPAPHAPAWTAFDGNLRTRPRLWDYALGQTPAAWP